MSSFIKLIYFLLSKKRYWFYPIFFVYIFAGVLTLIKQSNNAAPWIYTAF